jgi:hypothetical protein
MTSPDWTCVDVQWRRARQFIRTKLKKQDIRVMGVMGVMGVMVSTNIRVMGLAPF